MGSKDQMSKDKSVIEKTLGSFIRTRGNPWRKIKPLNFWTGSIENFASDDFF